MHALLHEGTKCQYCIAWSSYSFQRPNNMQRSEINLVGRNIVAVKSLGKERVRIYRQYYTKDRSLILGREERRARKVQIKYGRRQQRQRAISSALTYLRGSSSGTSSLRWVAQKIR